MDENRQRSVAILIFDDVEVLDFCGPFEVFSVTSRTAELKPFAVFTVAEELRPVLARNGLSVNPHYSLANCPHADILLAPGGWGTRREMRNERLVKWIAERAAPAELVLSVCTGALLLAKAGLLDGLDATTHHAALDLLRETCPAARVAADARYLDNGRIVTSAGISAGIDMSLHVVSRLLGAETARETAKCMEYDWRES